MTWGTGPWGSGSPWGTGSVLPPPSIIAVSSEPGLTAEKTAPAVVDELGGTICRVVGTNFYDPTTIELLIGGPGAYEVVANGYVVDAVFDLRANYVVFGSPALALGLYHLRVTTEGGESSVLENVIASRAFAKDHKIVSVRSKYAPKWRTGPRYLKG